MSMSQSWEAWKGVDTDETPHRTGVEVAAGSVAVAVETRMDENHPLYLEWAEHVDNQSHQGC